jgi:hypothetical protein
MNLDEQDLKIPSVQECPRESCPALGEPFTIDTENYDGQARIVWGCTQGHIFTTDLQGQDKQS